MDLPNNRRDAAKGKMTAIAAILLLAFVAAAVVNCRHVAKESGGAVVDDDASPTDDDLSPGDDDDDNDDASPDDDDASPADDDNDDNDNDDTEKMGACCRQDGECRYASAAACLGDQTWHSGQTCGDLPCGWSTGACCFLGLCLDDTQSDCVAQIGEWQAGQSCAAEPCGWPAMGACCVYGVCYDGMSEAGCTVLELGTFHLGKTCVEVGWCGTPCGPANCSGCCNGSCYPGASNLECGCGGAACVECNEPYTCFGCQCMIL